MDFVTTVIIIVVTALTNLLIMGVLGIFFKRGIEKSFDEHIEKYKNALQRELGEHQTRFVRNHEKAADALDKLYRDFSELSKVLLTNILVLITWCDPKLHQTMPQEETEKRKARDFDRVSQLTQKYIAQSSEIFQYWKQNDHYLSSEMNKTIQVIMNKTSAYSTHVGLLNTFVMQGFPQSEVYFLNLMIENSGVIFGVSLPSIEADAFSVQAFLNMIQGDMIESKKVLESLYKKEADLV